MVFQNCAPNQNFSSDGGATDSASSVPDPAPGISLIQGSISNALTNAAISGATIKVRKASSPSTVAATVTSNGSGNYATAALAAGSYLVDISASGFITISGLAVTVKTGQTATLNQSLSPVLATGEIRIVLNWASKKTGAVRDIDAYLLEPGASLPVYWNEKIGTNAVLDIDVQMWKGPETITISNVASGTYKYYVANYSYQSSATALGNSEVRVTIYKGASVLKSYTIKPGSGLAYEFFRIVNGQIQDIEAYSPGLLYIVPDHAIDNYCDRGPNQCG